MSDLFMDRQGVYLETVSMGKGFVEFNVHFPTMARRNPNVKKHYSELEDAARDIKRYLPREAVDPETVALVEKVVPEGGWGPGAS